MNIARWIYCQWLRVLIWDTERYLRECTAAGIVGTRSIAEFRRQIDAMRCELAIVRAHMQSRADSTPTGADHA